MPLTRHRQKERTDVKLKNDAGEVFDVTEHKGGEIETKAGRVDVAPGMLLLTHESSEVSVLHPNMLPNYRQVK